MRILPIDRKSFIDLEILTGFDTTTTQNALVRIIAIERVRIINLVGFRAEWNALMFDAQQFGGVMDRTIAVAVIADRAVKQVVTQDSVERFRLRLLGQFRLSAHRHSRGNGGGACPYQFPIDLDHAGIAGLDWTKLRVITHLREFGTRGVEYVDESFAGLCFNNNTIDCDSQHPYSFSGEISAFDFTEDESRG
jgi:hypothetical protein